MSYEREQREYEATAHRASPDDIERDIEQTRSDMGRTMEEIGDRVSPKAIYRRRKRSMGQRWQGMRRRVFGDSEPGEWAGAQAEGMQERIKQAPHEMRQQVQGNPMAAGLIAFGAGMLLGSMMTDTRMERRLVAEAKPELDEAKERVRSSARAVMEDVKQTAGSETEGMKQSASEAASHVKDETKQPAEEARRQAG